jgi:predicted DNA-binding transcriptional regulator YafY
MKTDKPKKTSHKIPTVERLINLSAFLLNEKKPQTLRSIVDQVDGYERDKDFESNRRMFIRDKKALADLGIPIRLAKTNDPLTGYETEAYKIDSQDFYLSKILFSENEVAALMELGRRISGGAGGSPIRELDWALAKIASAAGRPAAGALPAEPVLFQLERLESATDPDLLAALQDAAADRRTVKLRYHSPDTGGAVDRRVDPYGLFLRRGFWYLYGYCHLRKGPRLFRLDHLELLAAPEPGGGPDFEPPTNFSIQEQAGLRAPWEFGAESPTTAVIRFHPDLFWQIRNAWGDLPSVSLNENENSISVKSVNNEALISWTLGFSDRAEIVSPPALRKRIADILKGILTDAGEDA